MEAQEAVACSTAVICSSLASNPSRSPKITLQAEIWDAISERAASAASLFVMRPDFFPSASAAFSFASLSAEASSSWFELMTVTALSSSESSESMVTP
jgi:hypothetical protein